MKSDKLLPKITYKYYYITITETPDYLVHAFTSHFLYQ